MQLSIRVCKMLLFTWLHIIASKGYFGSDKALQKLSLVYFVYCSLIVKGVLSGQTELN